MLSIKSELEAQLIRLCRAERTRFEPRSDHQIFISTVTFHIVFYQFSLLVLCAGHGPTDMG